MHAACRGGLDCRFGAGLGEERTKNIWCMLVMSVRLDVSKLSGWLNADAHCRESKGGHTVWEEVQGTGRSEAAGDRGARSLQGRARVQIGSRARGGAHEEHFAHGYDAGGVEAQRLVERRRSLPIERKVYDAGLVAGGGGRPRRTPRARDCRLGAGHGEERT